MIDIPVTDPQRTPDCLHPHDHVSCSHARPSICTYRLLQFPVMLSDRSSLMFLSPFDESAGLFLPVGFLLLPVSIRHTQDVIPGASHGASKQTRRDVFSDVKASITYEQVMRSPQHRVSRMSAVRSALTQRLLRSSLTSS